MGYSGTWNPATAVRRARQIAQEELARTRRDEPLVWYEGSSTGTRRWFHQDERGSVIAVSDAGGTASILTYDEYGIPGKTNAASRFGYTGQTWLPEVGLYHYKARTYSPTLGRFLQSDPIGYGDGMNMYAYVGNNPINRIDPLGLACYLNDSHDGSVVGDTITASHKFVLCYSDDGGGSVGGNTGQNGTDGSHSNEPIDPLETPKVTLELPKNVCNGAPVASGTGSTPNELMAQARLNGAKAAMHSAGGILNLDWFRNQVRNGGVWDYKQYSRGNPTGYQAFGNYNYGYTGAAAGYSLDFL